MSNLSYIKIIIATLMFFMHLDGFSATTDTVQAKSLIDQHGSNFPVKNIGLLRDIYKKHLNEANYIIPEIIRDISYGDHSLQVLDLHLPKQKNSKKLPVILFVHGGAFVRGDKSDHIIFDNVLNFFTRFNFIGVNINYRLAPKNKWPSGANDIAQSLEWIHNNADTYNIDKNKIFLMGHSAGAAHVASYSFDESLQMQDGNDGVLGSILMSGVYANVSNNSKTVYYGTDHNNIPINHIAGRIMPLFIIDAEFDKLTMQMEAINLLQKICMRDSVCPHHKQITGHNHYSMMYHFNTLDDSIASDILYFMNQIIQ